MRFGPLAALITTMLVAGCDTSATASVPQTPPPAGGARGDVAQGDCPAECYGPHTLKAGTGLSFSGQEARGTAEAWFQWVNKWTVTGTISVTSANGHEFTHDYGGSDSNFYAFPWQEIKRSYATSITSDSYCGSSANMTLRAGGGVVWGGIEISSDEMNTGSTAAQDPCPTRTATEGPGGGGGGGGGPLGGGGGGYCIYQYTYDLVTGFIYNKALISCPPGKITD